MQWLTFTYTQRANPYVHSNSNNVITRNMLRNNAAYHWYFMSRYRICKRGNIYHKKPQTLHVTTTNSFQPILSISINISILFEYWFLHSQHKRVLQCTSGCYWCTGNSKNVDYTEKSLCFFPPKYDCVLFMLCRLPLYLPLLLFHVVTLLLPCYQSQFCCSPKMSEESFLNYGAAWVGLSKCHYCMFLENRKVRLHSNHQLALVDASNSAHCDEHAF